MIDRFDVERGEYLDKDIFEPSTGVKPESERQEDVSLELEEHVEMARLLTERVITGYERETGVWQEEIFFTDSSSRQSRRLRSLICYSLATDARLPLVRIAETLPGPPPSESTLSRAVASVRKNRTTDEDALIEKVRAEIESEIPFPELIRDATFVAAERRKGRNEAWSGVISLEKLAGASTAYLLYRKSRLTNKEISDFLGESPSTVSRKITNAGLWLESEPEFADLVDSALTLVRDGTATELRRELEAEQARAYDEHPPPDQTILEIWEVYDAVAECLGTTGEAVRWDPPTKTTAFARAYGAYLLKSRGIATLRSISLQTDWTEQRLEREIRRFEASRPPEQASVSVY